MTTELEEQFFNMFGIEPKIDYDYKTIIQNITKTGYWFDKKYLIKMFNDNPKIKVTQVRKNINYPEITDCKLLEMICILGTAIRHFKIPPKLKLEQLKYHILRNCINEQEGIYTRIQQLFKEEE